MFITLIMVMTSQVFAYAQTHQIVHIKYTQFLNYINYASITVVKIMNEQLEFKLYSIFDRLGLIKAIFHLEV